MIKSAKTAEEEALLSIANQMCAVARTAPKTKGQDFLDFCILTGDAIEKLACEMEMLSKTLSYSFFLRDAQNVRQSGAVVLFGTEYTHRGLKDGCGYCHYKNCDECIQKGGLCMYDGIDLGIAIGSAVSLAANHGIDNRVMFSAGRAALEMGILSDRIHAMIAVPLSVSKKSPYFDRK